MTIYCPRVTIFVIVKMKTAKNLLNKKVFAVGIPILLLRYNIDKQKNKNNIGILLAKP